MTFALYNATDNRAYSLIQNPTRYAAPGDDEQTITVKIGIPPAGSNTVTIFG
jgi:hypothetical protein